jgi:predicted nucleic acid binding AN1-type Zn finger protein
MKKIMFLLGFVSISIFASAYDGSKNQSTEVTKVETKMSGTSRLLNDDVCVTIPYTCPVSSNGTGSGSCTACVSSHTFGQAAGALANMQAAHCVGVMSGLCPA